MRPGPEVSGTGPAHKSRRGRDGAGSNAEVGLAQPRAEVTWKVHFLSLANACEVWSDDTLAFQRRLTGRPRLILPAFETSGERFRELA